jgi:HPt (histidine-containing phosphotransfer) domain-containing protein
MADDLQQKLAALRQQFMERFADRLKVIEAAVGRVGSDPEAVKSLRGECHKIAGTAGTFGFAAIGEAASEIEMACDHAVAAGAPLNEKERAAIDPLLAVLRKGCG